LVLCADVVSMWTRQNRTTATVANIVRIIDSSRKVDFLLSMYHHQSQPTQTVAHVDEFHRRFFDRSSIAWHNASRNADSFRRTCGEFGRGYANLFSNTNTFN
jgi:hypothetical protein